MSVIGSLLINLKANTAIFDKKMKRSRGGIRSLTKTVKNARNAMLAFVAAAGAFRAIRGIGTVIEDLDRLGKVARKLGATTEGLMALRLAAKLTGIATTTLDMAIQRMVRRIAEAGQGMGEAQAALRELGLNAEKLAKVSPFEQFKAIAGAMKKVRSEGDKLRLSFKLFDSEGAALKNTLALGTEGLEDMRKQLQKLGASFSSLDISRIEAANDALDKMKIAGNALLQSFVIEIAPHIASMADAMAVWLSNGQKNIPIIVSLIEETALSMAALVDEINESKDAIDRVIGPAKAFQTMMTVLFFGRTTITGGGLVGGAKSRVDALIARLRVAAALRTKQRKDENDAAAKAKANAPVLGVGLSPAAIKKSTDMEKSLRMQIDLIKLGKEEFQLQKLIEAGGNFKQVIRLQGLQRELKSLQRKEDMKKREIKLAKDFRRTQEDLAKTRKKQARDDALAVIQSLKSTKQLIKDERIRLLLLLDKGLLTSMQVMNASSLFKKSFGGIGTFAEISTSRRTLQGLGKDPVAMQVKESNKLLKKIVTNTAGGGGLAA